MSTNAGPARRTSISTSGPSRRRVLGAAGAGLTLATGLPQLADAAELPLLGTYDVVVIGSGAAGVPDTPAKAAAYLAAVVGDDVPADRQKAFLDHGPAMLSFVMAHSPLRF